MLHQPHPAAADQTGDSYTFEKHVSTLHGGKGFADVWKRGYLRLGVQGQAQGPEGGLSPARTTTATIWRIRRLLVVCDQDRFEVHTNFTGTRPQVYRFTLDRSALAAPTRRIAPCRRWKFCGTSSRSPEQLRPERAASPRHRGGRWRSLPSSPTALSGAAKTRERVAHFLMRLLFCLFADSIGLLPEHLFRQMIELDKGRPASFTRKLRQLFAAMSTQGNNFGDARHSLVQRRPVCR